MSFSKGVTNPEPATSNAVAVRVSQLSKHYRLYEKPEDRLKESLYGRLNRWLGRQPVVYCRQFKALSNVTFEVKRGETVGIIGRNGSGKSTLLQMISGTLKPTHGQIEVNGRVAALLELGSGFHPEFTGRENVYMNAALFGMAAAEVESKFDDIAAFADIGEFIEQPVKTYSSGMMLRLAFAVIAHIDADILVIDEALSVGDAVFTQKCMRFIRTFQKRGTLLFVSHDMAAVQNLCQFAVWLEKGKVQAVGATRDTTDAYLRSTLQEIYGDNHQLHSNESNGQSSAAYVPGNEPSDPILDYDVQVSVQDNLGAARGWQTGAAEVMGVTLTSRSNNGLSVLKGGEEVRLVINAVAHAGLAKPILGFIVNDRLGQDLFGENTLPFTSHSPVRLEKGDLFQAEFDFKLPMLPNGEYVVMASVANGDLHDNVQHHLLHDALVIKVSSSKVRWGLTGIAFENVSLKVMDDD